MSIYHLVPRSSKIMPRAPKYLVPSLHKPGREENLPINSAQQENTPILWIYTRHPAIENGSIMLWCLVVYWDALKNKPIFVGPQWTVFPDNRVQLVNSCLWRFKVFNFNTNFVGVKNTNNRTNYRSNL